MADSNNDNDYRWLQEELTKDLQNFNESKNKRKQLEELENDSNIPKKSTTSEKRMTKEREHKMPIWVGLIVAVLLLGVAVGTILFGKRLSETALLALGLIKEDTKEIVNIPDNEEISKEVEPIITSVPKEKETSIETAVQKEDQIINILLLGLENIDGQNHADTILIASINVTDKTYHLTQVMRDIYVEIPEFGYDTIGTAYQYGSSKALIETIEKNFNLDINGYLAVYFDDFIKIIDSFDGIIVELTKDEAQYLNSTNYIMNPLNRSVLEGKQLLNGDQTLGYCRIQAVESTNKLSNDFGRVDRAKTVLNQIYKKVSKKSLTDLLILLNDFLPYIHTNMTKDSFQQMITLMTEIGFNKYDTLRLPIYKFYTSEEKNGGTVYVPDLDDTKLKIHEFIYGLDQKAEE